MPSHLENKLECISAFVVCRREFLLIRRCGAYLPGTWQMVSGGVQEGEKAFETALREIQEETGVQVHSLYSADAVETFYFKCQDRILSVPVFVAFVEKKAPVHLSPHEHDAYQWLSFEEAKEHLLFSEQKRVITHIYENFVLKQPHPFFRILGN